MLSLIITDFGKDKINLSLSKRMPTKLLIYIHSFVSLSIFLLKSDSLTFSITS